MIYHELRGATRGLQNESATCMGARGSQSARWPWHPNGSLCHGVPLPYLDLVSSSEVWKTFRMLPVPEGWGPVDPVSSCVTKRTPPLYTERFTVGSPTSRRAFPSSVQSPSGRLQPNNPTGLGQRCHGVQRPWSKGSLVQRSALRSSNSPGYSDDKHRRVLWRT